MSLVTLDEIKEWLGITSSTHDAILTVIQESVEQSILNYCETAFELTPITNEVIDGNKSDIIVPDKRPVASVQALYLHCDPDGSGGSLVDSDEYQVEDGAIKLAFYKQPFRRSVVRVDYTYGYDGVPGDVHLAVLQAVEAEFRRKGRKSIGLASRAKKDESEGYTNSLAAWDKKTGLPKEVVYKLGPYKSGPEFGGLPMAQRNV